MIRHRGPAKALAIAFALALSSAAAAAQAQKTYNVADTAQFLKAIGPDRTIVLRKGDYRLSSAYSVTSDYVSWLDGDGGKELELSGLQNLTIRGADGARIVSDSAFSGIMAIYESSGITLDNLAFARTQLAGDDAGAGSLYAESVDGLVVDRCSFSGGATLVIDLWECSGVKIKRTSVSDAYQGALSACYSSGIEVSGSSFSGCEGYPLFYFEDCGSASVDSTSFNGNSGGTFVEIYDSEGGEGAVSFSNCDFNDNDFEYFSGSSALPRTLGCSFDGNSFGEDWELSAVAPGEEEYYRDDWWSDEDYENYDDYVDTEDYEEYVRYEHDSGLGFEYPVYWELRDSSYKSRAGVFSSFGSTFVLVLTPYVFPSGAKAPTDQAAFASALSALAKSLKDESSLALSVKAEGGIVDVEGLVSQEYSGQAAMGKGESAWARVKLIKINGRIVALVAMAKDASSLEADTDADYVFSSISLTQ